MSKQKTLDSFFGGPPPPKKKNPQTKLDSFFGKKNATGATSIEKENSKNPPSSSKRSNEVLETKKKASKPTISTDAKRRRRVIDDDDSDDEDQKMADPVVEKPVAEEEPTKNPVDKEESKELKESKKVKSPPPVEKKAEMKKSVVPAKKETKSVVSDNKKTATTKSKVPSATNLLPYSELCETFDKVEAITGRLEIQEILTKLFRKCIESGNCRENLLSLIYLCSNSVAPAYECVELGIGDSLLIKALAEAYGSTIESVKSKYDDIGDLGKLAQTLKSSQRTLSFFSSAQKKQLTCQEVLTKFRDIANMKGGKSQSQKVGIIKKMLVSVTNPLEPKYIVRGLQGKLRIGLAETTVLIAFAHALTLSVPPQVDPDAMDDKEEVEMYPEEAKNYLDKKLPKEKKLEAAVAILKKAYNEVPSYDSLVDAVLEVPLHMLHKQCCLQPGIPVTPMLAKPTKSIMEVLKRLSGQRFTAEYKYDGERAQVHMLADKTTKVFSRNLLDTTSKYPEVPEYVQAACDGTVKSCVLDTEVVAYDAKKQRLVPFQVLSTRKKTEDSAESATVKVIVQAFDLMYLNGESLLSRTLQERRELLRKHFTPVEGKFCFAVSLDHEENGDTAVLEDFLDEAIKGQCEGLMIKTLDVNAIYEPSRRSLNWLKLKKDYLEGLGDSCDLVPIGAYHGKGKRTGVYGAYLLACYDPDAEEFQSVCKIGTGFSDEDLKSLSETLNKHKIPQKSSQYNVTDQLECDVWFDSVQVWEIKAADLSKSSAHRGAVGKTGEEDRGIGLRFPRFERIRPDKKPEEATTSDQILEMYYAQDSVGGAGNDEQDDGI